MTFSCHALGDPPPLILWRRVDGDMPEGRTHILADKSLQITSVQIADDGNYACKAENSVGMDDTTFTLTVQCEYFDLDLVIFRLSVDLLLGYTSFNCENTL